MNSGCASQSHPGNSKFQPWLHTVNQFQIHNSAFRVRHKSLPQDRNALKEHANKTIKINKLYGGGFLHTQKLRLASPAFPQAFR